MHSAPGVLLLFLPFFLFFSPVGLFAFGTFLLLGCSCQTVVGKVCCQLVVVASSRSITLCSKPSAQWEEKKI